MDTVKMRNISQNTRDNIHESKIKNQKGREGEEKIPDGMLAKQIIKTTLTTKKHKNHIDDRKQS